MALGPSARKDRGSVAMESALQRTDSVSARRDVSRCGLKVRRLAGKHKNLKQVNWCFTPSQPVRLYQGDQDSETKNDC